MAKNIHVIVDDDDHEWLKRLKEEHGLTWKGMLFHAGNDLEDN